MLAYVVSLTHIAQGTAGFLAVDMAETVELTIGKNAGTVVEGNAEDIVVRTVEDATA